MKKRQSKIQEQTTTGGAVVNVGGHVDLPLGQFDRPGPTGQRYGEKPIVPSEMVAVQLAVAKPPIDDDKYIPVSRADLSLAASEISKKIPDEQISVFYRKLKMLAQQCIDNKETSDLKDRGELEMSESKKIAYMNKLVRMINEALDKMPEVEDALPPEVGVEPKSIEQEEAEFKREWMKLDDLAKEFGFSGGSGARQWVSMIARRIKGFTLNVNEDSIAELQNMAVADYIEILERADLIEEDDAEEMMENYDEVMELGSFRYFFVKAFILPAFKISEKNKEDDIRDAMENIGVPRQIQDTVYYQLVGRSAKDRKYVSDRFASFVNNKFEVKDSEGRSTGQYDQLTPQRSREIQLKLGRIMPSLEMRASRPDDYLSIGETYYSSLSDMEKAKILLQSLDQTQEDVEGVKSYKV